MKAKKVMAALVGCLMLSGVLHAADQSVELSADVLEYDASTGLVKATGSVRMHQGEAVVTGQSAEYNNKTQEGKVTGGVTLHKEDMNMTCAEVRTDGASRVVADGDVVVTKGDSVLAGPRADYDMEREYVLMDSGARMTMPDGVMTSDRLEADLKENRAVATGGVHIVSAPRNLEATGDQATYEAANRGQVVLSGNAVATQDNNTLRGNRVTLYLGEQNPT